MSLSELGAQAPMQNNPMTANPVTGTGPSVATSFGSSPTNLGAALHRPAQPFVTPGTGIAPNVSAPQPDQGQGLLNPGGQSQGSGPGGLAGQNAQQAMMAAQQGRMFAPSLESGGGGGGGGGTVQQLLKNPDVMKMLASFGA